MTPEEKFASFDRLGESVVRYKLATYEFQGTEANLAIAWLSQRTEEKVQAIANRAEWISIIAILISFIATLLAAVLKSA